MNNDTSNDESAPLEVLHPSAIMAMESAQIDMQISTAHKYPRSLEKFRSRAMAMATLDADTAESCIYVRPVGKEKDKATGEWKEKFAEGPSIRLAEIVAVAYGNIRAAVKIVEQTERYVKCTGMAHDLESNTAMQADIMEATVTKEGNPYSERQRALIAKVCAAKAIRDAIFKVVPRALCKPILEAAKKVATGADRPIEERRKKAQAWVQNLKIDDQRALAVLGVKEWAQVTNDHLVILTGLKTAMSDGDETIDSAFPYIEPTKESNKPKATGLQKMAEEQEKTAKAAATAPKADKKEEDNVRMDFPATGATTKAPETPQDAPDGKAAAVTPPEAQTPAPAAEAAAAAPAPEASAPAEAAPAEEPAGPPDPFLNPEPGDTDSVASVKLLAQKSGVNWFQLKTYLLAKHLMRPEQKTLSELATTKLDGVARNFSKWLPDLRKLPRSAD